MLKPKFKFNRITDISPEFLLKNNIEALYNQLWSAMQEQPAEQESSAVIESQPTEVTENKKSSRPIISAIIAGIVAFGATLVLFFKKKKKK